MFADYTEKYETHELLEYGGQEGMPLGRHGYVRVRDGVFLEMSEPILRGTMRTRNVTELGGVVKDPEEGA
eukprot:7863623-Heterocapsa_arctica.AAC.1